MSKAKILIFLSLIIIVCSRSMSGAEPIFIELDLNGKEDTIVYPGQELTLTASLHAPAWQRVKLDPPPRLEFDNAAPADFSDLKSPFPDFHTYDTENRQINDENYRIYHFSTIFSPITAGTVTGEGEISLSVMETEEQPPPLHYRFSNTVGNWLRLRKRVARDKNFILPDLAVAPLPAHPAGRQFTGLVGDWRIQVALSASRLQVQTPVELLFEAVGRGSPDRFQAPELSLPGFLTEGPEISHRRLDKRTSRVTARWVIIPQLPSIRIPELQWTSFSPRAESYIKHNIQLAPAIAPVSPPEREETFPSPAPPAHEERWPLTWWQRHFWLLIIAGLLVLIIILGITAGILRTGAVSHDQMELRRRQTIKKGASISRQLRDCDQDQLAIIMKSQVVPWLIDLLQMPPGTTPEALAEELKNIHPELSAMIELTDHLQFAPELKKQLDGEKIARSLIWIGQEKTGLILSRTDDLIDIKAVD